MPDTYVVVCAITIALALSPSEAFARQSTIRNLVSEPRTSGIADTSSAAFPTPAESCSDTPPGTSLPGGVLTNPQVLYVDWGGAVDPTLDSFSPQFYTEIISSEYIKELGAQYGTGNGNYIGKWVLQPQHYQCNSSPCTIHQSDVETELRGFSMSGGFQVPTILFMVRSAPQLQSDR